MTVDWTALDAELAIWRTEGLHLPIWWRDDDAIAPTPALDRLAALAEDLSLPVHIAVIPKHADPALAAYSKDRPLIRPLVHGWQHISHAPDGAKKAEMWVTPWSKVKHGKAAYGAYTDMARFMEGIMKAVANNPMLSGAANAIAGRSRRGIRSFMQGVWNLD